ncbi:hypothetical protein B0T09DRAFT_407388, partial [Sordaria sp. MPI-SDFR-AT-0083]
FRSLPFHSSFGTGCLLSLLRSHLFFPTFLSTPSLLHQPTFNPQPLVGSFPFPDYPFISLLAQRALSSTKLAR